MTEDVLQYVWKTQSFNKENLKTSSGELIRVLKQGHLNEDSGPDFSAARIVIGEVEWVGDVEIHIKASSWKQHKHHCDPSYNKVILHVVWEEDTEALRSDGTKIPTLELESLVEKNWLLKCHSLLSSIQTIPCEPFICSIDDIHKTDAFNKALIERLERKSKIVLANVKYLQGDWEQATQDLLFEYFGFKKNNQAFKQLSSVTDYRIIRKLNSLLQVEAYLLGMAGLLQVRESNTYLEELRSEFAWIKRKFDIPRTPMSLTWWKFMRMRPANFPTLRIAQLAALLYNREHIFKSLTEGSVAESAFFFKVEQSEFWQNHYHFNKATETSLKGLGKQSASVMSINVAAVLLVAYGNYTNNEKFIEKAINLLETQMPENNVITRKWQNLAINLTNAAESQGAIELFNNYCKEKACLHCNIGNQVLAGL